MTDVTCLTVLQPAGDATTVFGQLREASLRRRAGYSQVCRRRLVRRDLAPSNAALCFCEPRAVFGCTVPGFVASGRADRESAWAFRPDVLRRSRPDFGERGTRLIFKRKPGA